MKCPHCQQDSRVVDSRDGESNSLRRRRECIGGHRFTTYERVSEDETVRALRSMEQRISRLEGMFHPDSFKDHSNGHLAVALKT